MPKPENKNKKCSVDRHVGKGVVGCNSLLLVKIAQHGIFFGEIRVQSYLRVDEIHCKYTRRWL